MKIKTSEKLKKTAALKETRLHRSQKKSKMSYSLICLPKARLFPIINSSVIMRKVSYQSIWFSVRKLIPMIPRSSSRQYLRIWIPSCFKVENLLQPTILREIPKFKT